MPENLTPLLGSFIILRADGSQELVLKKPSTARIREYLKYDVFDTFNLRDGRVVMVSDTGMLDHLPVNAKATALYHGICRQGTVHCIHGDAAIANDEDFA